ncbi:hypothetical protein J6590_048884 [Homalodisca vitripennis]|nr:hypothetical protein J6590_048884 [Homalodisca vitripennis]
MGGVTLNALCVVCCSDDWHCPRMCTMAFPAILIAWQSQLAIYLPLPPVLPDNVECQVIIIPRKNKTRSDCRSSRLFGSEIPLARK